MESRDIIRLRPGEIVSGRFEVVKCLGSGSMGVVYACKHRELKGHFVALKVLYPEVAKDPVSLQRFQNEIVASYAVSHRNVIRTYEYFQEGDFFAFTMEYVRGGDLADRLAGRKPFSIPEVIKILTQVAAGVEAIHAAGIIHRDLKPENLLLTPEGVIKITDFGIARSSGAKRLTEHGGLVGTLDYVSPEYLESGEVDERADIYAIGVLAYEMLLGHPPFQGKTVLETMAQRLKTEPQAVAELRADCPKALSELVSKAMAREVSRRYPSARRLLDDLKKIDSRKGGSNIRATITQERRIEKTIRNESISVGKNHLPAERVRSLSAQLTTVRNTIRGSVWMAVCFLLASCFVLAVSIYSSQVS